MKKIALLLSLLSLSATKSADQVFQGHSPTGTNRIACGTGANTADWLAPISTNCGVAVSSNTPTAAGNVLCATGTVTAQYESPSTCGLATSAISVQTPTLLNSWVAAGSHQAPGYYKDSFGQVHLIGAVSSGTATATIFTLPTGYLPSAQRWCTSFVWNGSTNVLAIVQIDTTGNVSMAQGSPANTNLNLECVFNT